MKKENKIGKRQKKAEPIYHTVKGKSDTTIENSMITDVSDVNDDNDVNDYRSTENIFQTESVLPTGKLNGK